VLCNPVPVVAGGLCTAASSLWCASGENLGGVGWRGSRGFEIGAAAAVAVGSWCEAFVGEVVDGVV
jgi:hypothetical protein